MSEVSAAPKAGWPTLAAFQREMAEICGDHAASLARSSQGNFTQGVHAGEYSRRAAHYALCAGCDFCHRRRAECEAVLAGR
jgi:hypothetical protein